MIQERNRGRTNTISDESVNEYRQKKSYEANKNKKGRYRTEPVQNRKIVQHGQMNVKEKEITRERNEVIFKYIQSLRADEQSSTRDATSIGNPREEMSSSHKSSFIQPKATIQRK